VLVGALGLLTWGTDAWASVRLAPDIELQAWYRMRHSFQTDSHHFDWVQWRNEGFIWLTYDNFYQRGKLFNKFEIPLPLVDSASVSARWRSRVDPVYILRDRYKTRYDEEHTENFLVPENGFRDLYVDLDHGRIGPGRLFTRWGYQQVVWGESDLFRSIDIVNPLRIDQNLGAGEKFDEFRSPILALKALGSPHPGGREQLSPAVTPFFPEDCVQSKKSWCYAHPRSRYPPLSIIHCPFQMTFAPPCAFHKKWEGNLTQAGAFRYKARA
jgi:hypothetical protein